MTKQRSWCCGFIPGFWWWFLTLLGLPLLFLLMTYFRQGVVEGDLTNRVSQALTAQSMDWAEVDVKHRGRDVLIKGIPPSADDRSRALTVAQGVYGVHKVDFAVDSGAGNTGTNVGSAIGNAGGSNENTAVTDDNATAKTVANTEVNTEATLILPTLNIAQRDGKMTLQGSLPSQQEIDGLVIAAGQKFGRGNVNNQLTVGEGVATPGWLSSAGDLLSVLPGEGAMLTVSDQSIELGGEVNSASDKRTLLSRANRLFGDGVVDKITVRQLLPPEVEIALAGGKMTLSGKVASQQQVDTLLRVAAGRAGADNVVNQLEVSKAHGDAAWMDSAQQLVSNLLPENGAAKIAGGRLEITGEVDSEEARTQWAAKSDAFLKDAGLALVNNLALRTAQNPDNSESQEASVASEAAALACQEKLDAAMKGKNILFRVNKADIRNESHALLDELAGIVAACNDALSGKQVAIGGHTDSDGSERYNLQLSQRRADAVRTYLTDKGVSSGLLNAKGFGESQPVAGNDTAAGKAQNRRISFEIKTAE